MSVTAPEQDVAAALEATAREVSALAAQLDRLANRVEALDRAREDVADLVEDLAPAANGMLRLLIERMDALERSGALDAARGAADAVVGAARAVDPETVRALGRAAPDTIRLLQAVSRPEVAAVANAAVDAVHAGATGRPPSWWRLLRAARQPRVRRGLRVLLDVLRALGSGPPRAAPPSRSPVVPRTATPTAPAAPPAAHPDARPRVTAGTAPGATSAAVACHAGHGNRVARRVELAGVIVDLDAEGFLVDRDAWSPDLARALAAAAGVDLGPRHWEVIEFCRADATAHGQAPGVRRITRVLGIAPREIYALFPGGPGILAARIAGLPKPKSCV